MITLAEIKAMEVDYGLLADELEDLNTGYLKEWVAR